MLEISKITKDYELKDQKVNALKGVDIIFRRSEFVSILGPSGCGKTTLLNIIGGLDRYTSGDLIIDGVSTKEFKDKDWDNYRNHRVGFVFQNYNLIPHQTVLENVELALTLSGVKKKERRARAIEVLNKVGLGDKLKSRPNQLSGGQMQRVAIARALVNDPEIILADEPTGALDSKTSVQIMEILKEVSKDRLVIMVTHNPELADTYSSRIIKFLDGELKEDSKPYTKSQADKEVVKYKEELAKKEPTFKKKEKKKSMSFFTAFALSMKNLLTKKGRTIMVSFAGSIGIIGIALILAVSAGMTNYINNTQSQSLSSYPVSVSAVTVDMNNISGNLSNANTDQGDNDDELAVYDMLETLKNFGEYNYLGSDFVNHIKDYYNQNSKKDLLNTYNISYSSDMHLITDIKKTSLETMPEAVLNTLPDTLKYPINSEFNFSAMQGTTSSLFFETIDNEGYIKSIYDVKGTYPTKADEIALVLDKTSIDNTTLLSYGIDLPEKIEESEETIANGTAGKYNTINFNDIIGKEYKLIMNDQYYDTNNLPKIDFEYAAFFTKPSDPKAVNIIEKQPELITMAGSNNTDLVLPLKITAILTLKEDASGSIFQNGFMYTKALKELYRTNCKDSQIVENVRNRYTISQDGTTFENGDLEFFKEYAVRISELDMLTSMYSGIDAGTYTYKTPNAMKKALYDYFKITLTPAQTIDLYLQAYGASDVPTGLQFYCKTFEAKDDLKAMIAEWNSSHEFNQINISDNSTLLTNMLGGIVNIISYVLVAFASISLIVSSVMIGIITYTSVIERTKEIGVLRSVGASKRDISRVFNAETVIIGLTAGVLGVLLSAILCIPINLILQSVAGISNMAILHILPCVILIAISVFLTFIAGLIPARIASKKDPVLALRSE